MRRLIGQLQRSEDLFDDLYTSVISRTLSRGTMIFARSSVCIGRFVEAIIQANCDRRPGLDRSILKGVTIGQGAIIGSRPVVPRDIPTNALAVGVPAKVIKTDVTWK